MNLANFIESLRQEFHQELSAKTGWGREELKMAFERASPTPLPRTPLWPAPRPETGCRS
jgi:hypothetical protein